jgi:hypothetical protein
MGKGVGAMTVHITLVPRRFIGELDALDVDRVYVDIEDSYTLDNGIVQYLNSVNEQIIQWSTTKTEAKIRAILDARRAKDQV